LPPNLNDLPALSNHKWALAHIHFARAVGAARSGDASRARYEVAKLAAMEQALAIAPGEYDWRKQIAIERQIAEAWTAYAVGKHEDALRLMRAAADLDDATEKNPVTPGAILPGREQLGELLLDLGRPGEALQEYEASLQRAPRRLAGLYGAAQSAKLAGDTEKASRYFDELTKMTEDGNAARVEVKTARRFKAGLVRNNP
jgi:tetratricopeptide (TPR) repeat protein